MFNEVALEAWLALDSYNLIGWNQKYIHGDHGGDYRQCDTLEFNATRPTRRDPRGDPTGITTSGAAAYM